jgi:hypothetical protein
LVCPVLPNIELLLLSRFSGLWGRFDETVSADVSG